MLIILFGMCINHFRSQLINLTRINNTYLQEAYLGLPNKSQEFFQISNNYDYSIMKCDLFSEQLINQIDCSSPLCSSCNNDKCQLNYTIFQKNSITATTIEMAINISIYNNTQDWYQLDNFSFFCLDNKLQYNSTQKGVLSIKQELTQLTLQSNLQFSTKNYSIYIGQKGGYIKQYEQVENISQTTHYIRYIDNQKMFIDWIQVVSDEFYDVQIQLNEYGSHFFASINTASYEVYAENILAKQLHSLFQSPKLEQQKIFYDQMPCYKWDKNIFSQIDQFIHSFQTFTFRLRQNFNYSWKPEAYLTKIDDLFCLPVKPLPSDSNIQLILGTSWMIGWEITFDELNGQLIFIQKDEEFQIQIIDDSKNDEAESLSLTVIIILSISIVIGVLILLYCVKKCYIQKFIKEKQQENSHQQASNAQNQIQSQFQSGIYSQELTQSRITSELQSVKSSSSTVIKL
ncbi:hypothetical protein pb186bvf_007321 [Paramecium bursaria]